jgi:hypothetical protein
VILIFTGRGWQNCRLLFLAPEGPMIKGFPNSTSSMRREYNEHLHTPRHSSFIELALPHARGPQA